ncbi:hypothetical protein E5D57_012592 [Metarhizium anisopliae]|nr:hypothetical protein E5D57_012592 [Metarhizium anisopliae]
MAAAEVLAFTESWRESGQGWFGTAETLRTGWDKRSLQLQLTRISVAWINSRSSHLVWLGSAELLPYDTGSGSNTFGCLQASNPSRPPSGRPLLVSDFWSRRSNRLPNDIPPPDSSFDVCDPTDTCCFARQRNPSCVNRLLLQKPGEDAEKPHRSENDLFSDPVLGVTVDFDSRHGIIEAAKKKKNAAQKAAAAAKAFDDNNGGDKNGDGEENNNGGGDQGGGDPGSGSAGGAGDGSGGGNGDEDKDKDKDKDGSGDVKEDDPWDDFMPAKSKKKKGKKGADAEAEAAPAVPTADVGGDAFHEIKLGDDSGGKLDMNFGSTDTKDSFGAWGTKWNTGGSGGGSGSNWDWSATGGGDAGAGTDPKKDELDSNPWNTKGSKAKNGKTTFSFGSLDKPETETEDQGSAGPKEDDFGFTTAVSGKKGKKKKGTSIWGADTVEDSKDTVVENTDAGTAGDPWGWTSTKKKGKKEELELEPEPEPEQNIPPPPVDDWMAPTSKSKKKKKGAVAVEEPVEPSKSDPEPLKEEADDIWDTWEG